MLHVQTPCANGTSTFLHQGGEAEEACFALCNKNPKCDFVTWHGESKGGHWCFNAQHCTQYTPYDGKGNGHDGAKPLPGLMANTHTWKKSKAAVQEEESAMPWTLSGLHPDIQAQMKQGEAASVPGGRKQSVSGGRAGRRRSVVRIVAIQEEALVVVD